MPGWMLPPGDILAAEMDARGWTPERVADGAPFDAGYVEDVLLARAAVTEALAYHLEWRWATPAAFWLRLESLWQEHLAVAYGEPDRG
jgi:plasmid maintenance system antidote protein VapI